MLANEELKRWFRAKRDGRRDREMKMKSLFRHVGLKESNFKLWLRGNAKLTHRMQRILSRFVEDWEAGLIEFVPDWSYPRANGQKARIVHRATPRPMPQRMTIDFSGSRPRLTLLGRPPRDRMPGFPEISGKLTPK